VAKISELDILAVSDRAGLYLAASKDGKNVYVTGHSEYDAHTLQTEYERDLNAGKPIHVPENYFPNDDPTKQPRVSWRSHGHLLFGNWINYYVYQKTPYDLESLSS